MMHDTFPDLIVVILNFSRILVFIRNIDGDLIPVFLE
jgi:hypothetical protein